MPPRLQDRGDLGENRKEINETGVDAADKLNGNALEVVELLLRLTHLLARYQAMDGRVSIAVVVQIPFGGPLDVISQQTKGLEVLHVFIIFQHGSAQEMMHDSSSFVPILALSQDCPLVTADKPTCNREVWSLSGDLCALRDDFLNHPLTVEHYPGSAPHT